jgi:hypothetical protein
MEARLIDLKRISHLLAGGASEATSVVDVARRRFPESWEFDPEYDDQSVGEELEALLTNGQQSGMPHPGPALQLLCQVLGESVDIASFEDVNMIHGFAAESLTGLPYGERLYGRLPLPLTEGEPGYVECGYVTPDEAQAMLEKWSEPDFDDPEPEIYAAREQIEGWLRSAVEAQKTLIVFWV